MSTRNFTRVFKHTTGMTVHQYITLLRQEVITKLSQQPDISAHQIASAVGLASERQIARLAQRMYS